MIPEDTFKEIADRVKNDWPDDPEMQKYCISAERDAYEAVHKIDFGKHKALKKDFIQSAKEAFDDWEDILSNVQSELSAYSELEKISVEGIESSILDEWKAEAAHQSDGFYGGQLDFIKEEISKHFSMIETRKAIDPIKNLLVEIEEIIGSECHNCNIRNYSNLYELQSIGRDFRYPVTFNIGHDEWKKWKVPSSMPSEELITGYYAFGANELNIYRALYKVIQHLRKNYGLQV